MSELLDQLRELFDSGNTEELAARCKAELELEPGDLQLLSYQAYSSIAEILRIYKNGANELYIKTSNKGTRSFISRIILGRDEFYTDSIHERYYADIEKAIDELYLVLERMPSDDPLRADLAAAAVKAILKAAPKDRSEMRFLLSADDGFILKLLPYCRKEDLASIRDDYLWEYPKKWDRLPNQEQLLKTIAGLLK